MKNFFWIIIPFFVLNSIQAQINVSAVFDSTQMIIGDQTDLHLNVNQPSASKVLYPTLSAESLGNFEIIEVGPIDTLKREPELITQQNITVSAYDSGYYQIPPLPFTIVRQNGRKDTIFSAPAAMIVQTIEVDTSVIAPIKPIIKQGYTREEITNYLLGVGVIILLGLFIYYWIKRYNKEEEVEEEIVIIPAHETAIKKLEELKKAKLWQNDQLKEYYSQLTYIVREYLEGRYEIRALESTTSEIFQELKRENFSQELKDQLRKVLQSADLVKFAKAAPTAELHVNAMNVAEDFILKTKQVIQWIENRDTEPSNGESKSPTT